MCNLKGMLLVSTPISLMVWSNSVKENGINVIHPTHPVASIALEPWLMKLNYIITSSAQVFYLYMEDPEIMSEQAKTIFLITTQSPEEWLSNFTEKCIEVEAFFKESAFNRLVETASNSDDPKLKSTLILTLDYFTNLTTFTFFLLWKWIHNENSQDMSNFVAGQGTINEFFV